MIDPSQTHISISQLNKNKETVKLSKSMRFYAAGGSWGNIFNVVAMQKEDVHGEQGEVYLTPHNRTLFALSAV